MAAAAEAAASDPSMHTYLKDIQDVQEREFFEAGDVVTLPIITGLDVVGEDE